MKKLMILSALFIGMMISGSVVKAQKIYDYVSVDKKPSFPGGQHELYSYLGKNIKYPAVARKNNIQGKVFLSFIVEPTGAISSVKVLKGVSKELNEEAVRVIKSSPNWNPAVLKGKPVRVMFNLPVNFTLS